jgi:hypothetical protein
MIALTPLNSLTQFALFAVLILLYARSRRLNSFQKMFGIWLFANSASFGMYRILCRMGISVAYTTVLRYLRLLAKGTERNIQHITSTSNFVIIYDNINRTRVMYSDKAPQCSVLLSGTASTLYTVEDGDLAAVDPHVIKEARQSNKRLGMTIKHIRHSATRHQEDLTKFMALHVLSFLYDSDPSFSRHKPWLRVQMDATKVECMRSGRRTEVHPLSTSDHNEGSVEGNRDVLDSIFQHQLKLTEVEIVKHLYLVGGDLATIEKLRRLQVLSRECPHGYAAYDWMLPLVQLWHMMWADLARIIGTHWGTDNREGSTLQVTNVLLGRNVKKVLRPDFYPAQKLVFDTLCAEVLDCFRYAVYTLNVNYMSD